MCRQSREAVAFDGAVLSSMYHMLYTSICIMLCTSIVV